MATPHVAGVAALLANQGYSNTQIRQIIESTSDKIKWYRYVLEKR